MTVLPHPWFRAEVLRALYKLTAGYPTLSHNEAFSVGSLRLRRRDLRFMEAAGAEDLALLGACLTVEEAHRREQFDALERLLVYTQFSDGDLDERLRALPDRAFACTVHALYELGWIG